MTLCSKVKTVNRTPTQYVNVKDDIEYEEETCLQVFLCLLFNQEKCCFYH